MMIKKYLITGVFTLCTLPALQANDATELALLRSRVAALELAAGSQYFNAPFYKIKSLNDLRDWAWGNKGNIVLATGCFVTVCIVRKTFNEGKKTRELLLRSNAHTRAELGNNIDALRSEVRDGHETITTNLHAIAEKVGAVQTQLPDKIQPESAGPAPVLDEDTFIGKAMDMIADGAISLGKSIVNRLWPF